MRHGANFRAVISSSCRHHRRKSPLTCNSWANMKLDRLALVEVPCVLQCEPRTRVGMRRRGTTVLLQQLPKKMKSRWKKMSFQKQ